MPSEKSSTSRRFNLRGKALILTPEPTLTEKARAIARTHPPVPGSQGPAQNPVNTAEDHRYASGGYVEDAERVRRNLSQALSLPTRLQIPEGPPVYPRGHQYARITTEGLHEYVRRCSPNSMVIQVSQYEALLADSRRLAALVRGDSVERASEMFWSSASERARNALGMENIRTLPLAGMLHHLDLHQPYYLGGAQHGRPVEPRYAPMDRVTTAPRVPPATRTAPGAPAYEPLVTQIYERRAMTGVTATQFVFDRLDRRQQDDCLRDVLRMHGTRRS